MAANFVIVSMGRTGSTLLVGLATSHPEVECLGEIISPHGKFSAFAPMSRKEFLERHAYETAKPIKGFKMPFDWAIKQAGVFEDLRQLGYRVIRLRRANLVAHLVSSKLAGVNMDYASQGEYAKQAITVSPWEFVQFVGYVSVANKCLDEMVEGFDIFDVEYAQLLNPVIHKRIVAFLGAKPFELTVNTVRSRTKPLQEVITNYSELSRFFRSSPYANMWPPIETVESV